MPGDATRGEEGGQCLLDPAPVELRKVEAIPLAQDFDTWRGNYEFTIVPESNFRTYLAGRREREDWERAVEGHTWYRGGAIIDEAAQTMFRADETHERMAVAAVTSGVLQQGIHNGDMILREYLQDPRDHGPSDPSEPMPTCELLGQVRNLYADPRSHREYHIGFRLHAGYVASREQAQCRMTLVAFTTLNIGNISPEACSALTRLGFQAPSQATVRLASYEGLWGTPLRLPSERLSTCRHRSRILMMSLKSVTLRTHIRIRTEVNNERATCETHAARST